MIHKILEKTDLEALTYEQYLQLVSDFNDLHKTLSFIYVTLDNQYEFPNALTKVCRQIEHVLEFLEEYCSDRSLERDWLPKSRGGNQ